MRTAITLMAAGMVALGAGAGATATTPSATTIFTALLKLEVKTTFKTKAPTLTLNTVTCRPPTAGKIYHCVARFTDASAKAKVVYPITASLKQGATLADGVRPESLRFTTSAPTCSTISTHAVFPC
jgi:hypothetical protein